MKIIERIRNYFKSDETEEQKAFIAQAVRLQKAFDEGRHDEVNQALETMEHDELEDLYGCTEVSRWPSLKRNPFFDVVKSRLMELRAAEEAVKEEWAKAERLAQDRWFWLLGSNSAQAEKIIDTLCCCDIIDIMDNDGSFKCPLYSLLERVWWEKRSENEEPFPTE